ncbi:MAG: DUF748 domain-containing protein [Pedobacter sp.]|nr:DUF748 domain-containing protein [Pedobacter sp.]
MLPADIKDRVAAQLTPRRRRYGLVFLALFIVWSIVGLFALPGVIVSQAQKFVQEKLHLELSIAKLEFNPWLLAVRIDGLKLKEPGTSGETLVAARSIYVNAQLWSSIWIRGASLDELDLLDPYINARIRKDGTINLMQLVPPDDPEEPESDANWRVGTLGIHRGRIDVHDDTRPTPFSALFSPLNLALSDLSSRPDKDGGYTLHAETGEGETLDWRGTVAMKPVRSEGELKISGLKATTPWRYLQDELPIIVEGGSIGISGHYKMVADNGLDFTLEQGRVVVDELQLLQRNKAPLSITLKQLDLNGVHVKLPEQKAGFDNLLLKDLLIADKAAGREFTRFGQLHLQGGSYEASPQSVHLAQLKLNELILADNSTPALITLPGLSMEKLAMGLAEQKAHVSRIVLEKGDLSVRRNKNGSLNWDTRLDELSRRLADNPLPVTAAPAPAEKTSSAPANKTAKEKNTKPAPAKPWQATLGELDLVSFRVGIEDDVPPGGVKTSLEDINLRIFPQLDGNAPHVLEGRMAIGTGGNLGFKGSFNEQPLAASVDLDLQALKLPPFAPYFADKARFALESGNLDVKGKFNFTQAKSTKADFNGSVAIQKFAANDLDQDQRFLAWSKLAVNGINWQMEPGKLSIREVLADKPFIRVIIGQDKTINLNRILIAEETPAAASGTETSTAATSAAPKKEEPPYPLRVDRIRFNDGAMLFADFTLNPQFATGIQSLNGDVRNISTDPKSRAKVDLKGRVDQYGKADINGVINPVSSDLYTDIKVQFSNLELTTLTPYSAKFAGYRIDKGKLSMDLNYKIEDRKLNATNKVVFNQLTLGEKVDSPDSIGLPLKLAVAILKDKNGVIDLDVPVTGSLDDPKFKVGPIIWKAFLNLLTKAATAPFTLIAGLVGGGDNMDAMIFPAGQTTLAPEETEKLNKLAKALAERPALGVEIRGAFDPAADALAVRTTKFDAVYLPRLGDSGKPRKVLEAMYKEKLGSEAMEQQRALSLKPAADSAQNKEQLQLAEENYAKVLRNELIARETVLEGDLRQLALQRASVVRAQLVDVAKVEESRVFVLEPVTVQATDGKIVMKVGLTAQ